MDKKFLEGFAEITAASGLSPSQAHELLTKESKSALFAGLKGFKDAWKAARPAAKSGHGFLRGNIKPISVGVGGTLAAGGVGYGISRLADAAKNQLATYNRYLDNYAGGAPQSPGMAAPSASFGPSYDHWGTPYYPTQPAAITKPEPDFIRDPEGYAAAKRSEFDARAQKAEIEKQFEEAQRNYNSSRERIDNPGPFDAFINSARNLPLIGGMAADIGDRPVSKLKEQQKKIEDLKLQQDRYAEQLRLAQEQANTAKNPLPAQ